MSKFREHLSLTLPPGHLHLPVEQSKFSPASTIDPSPRYSESMRDPFHRLSSKDIEAGSPQSSSSLRDRFTKLFFDLRTFHNAAPAQAQESRLSQWPPLNVEKRRCMCHHDPHHEAKTRRRKRRSRCLLILLIIILLFLIGNVTYLNVRVLPLINTASSLSTNPTTQVLSADALQCISQYTLNAPSSPSSYPCSACFATLQGVPSSFMSNAANSQDARIISNAVQFCSLRAVYETSDAQGQAALGNGSWSQNVSFCTWTGVTCDTSGRVSSLALTYPGVPATLSNEIGALADLQALTVVGGNTIPAGSLPESFGNLTAMTTLHLESTAITALPDALFSSPGLTNLSTLALLRNSKMGTSLPSSIAQLTGLHSLLVNSQALSPSPLSVIVNSSALVASLQTLDFTSTSLTGTIPASISSFRNLTQLLLSSNNLTGTVPTMPSTLKVLQFGGNSALTGNFACNANTLQTCSFAGTNVSVAGCGVCQNATASS
ncbi:RNI-like protein [Pisolithus marmoratus]|nr:RNI-like protein [Pisolithus marmoratus]